MKRRLLSAFLAVMMVLTMAPVAFAADTATSDGEALSKLFTDVHAGESGSGNVTVTIDKDYDLTGYQWTSLTVQGYTGAGVVTVEGNNHKITGLNAPLFAGGFAGTSGIVVKNLTLTNVNIKDSTSDQGIGAFINNVDSMPKIELDNCHLTDSSIDSNGGARVGGLIGWTSGYNKKNDGPVDTYITVTNCSVENTKITAKGSVGGIIGHAGANPATYHTFTNNTVTGCTLHSTDDGGWRVGVVVGTVNVGEVALNNTTESGNTVTQTGKTAPAGQSNLYGRFVPGTTGKLVIDGTAVFDSSIVAVVDNKGYKTLADAVAAAQDGDTITLLKDTIGSGIGTYKNPGKDLQGNDQITAKGFTIDFNQHTYSVDKPAVGSKTYETQGFHFEWKGAVDTTPNITLKNGTLNVAKVHDPNLKLLVQNYCNLTLDNMTVDGTNLTKGWGSYTYVTSNCNGTVTIKDSAIISENPNADVAFDVDGARRGYGPVKLTIEGDSKISGKFEVSTNEGNSLTVKGGYFTTDPSAYVASGYVAGTSDVSGYSYKVVAKTNTGNVEVKPDVADPEVTVSGSISEEDKKKVENAAKTVSAPTLGAETGDIVKDINEDTAKTLIEKATTVQGNNKKLYVQSSLKVEPTAYNETTKTLALKITPQYRIVASTAATADDIELGDNGKNAEVVQDYQPMNITKATVVTMELPTGFAVADGAKLSIKHTKSNGKVEYYTGTVTKKDNKLYLTFTTNGFSPFVISVPAAAIESKVYPTLQAAVDSAKNGDVIDLYKDVAADTKVTVAKPINFKVDANKKKFDAKKNIVAGTNTTVKVGETNPYTYEFTYTKPSSGGSSGGSSSGKTTYKVTTSAVNNGGVNASPSSAEKGATITITLSPDKGYKLDKLTVTDGSGKTVSTVKKSDTVYTFTMPASAVKVGVSYVKATETPSETKFNDVSANDWFASAVDYVTGKGMMNGTADNTFSPKANTTRGMVVTVLYRLENQPSTSAASFTDVASGAYYANAVAWANANGIVSGYGSGKFGPNDKVTREQLAAILYRYAQYKKYDVSVGEDTNILSYDDAQSISTYAIPAIQWACGAGVVTGKSGSKLDPKGNATRAEVAAMLMRFCENVK